MPIWTVGSSIDLGHIRLIIPSVISLLLVLVHVTSVQVFTPIGACVQNAAIWLKSASRAEFGPV